jgi:hypothetical protein
MIPNHNAVAMVLACGLTGGTRPMRWTSVLCAATQIFIRCMRYNRFYGTLLHETFT